MRPRKASLRRDTPTSVRLDAETSVAVTATTKSGEIRNTQVYARGPHGKGKADEDERSFGAPPILIADEMQKTIWGASCSPRGRDARGHLGHLLRSGSEPTEILFS
ncbi:hypothetical protein IFR05_005799 [Cadophora sp. M221]|nr:hypothetical protein IFR05_005799 [Cadophora sp. M221]